LVCELDRVSYQIDQHLTQAQGIGKHGFGQGVGQFRLQLQLLRDGLGAHQGNDFGHQLDRRAAGWLDLELSGFDLREVENVAGLVPGDASRCGLITATCSRVSRPTFSSNMRLA